MPRIRLLHACGFLTLVAALVLETSREQSVQRPDRTTDAGWSPVTEALARTGKFGDDDTMYRIALPRTDLDATPGS
ncbi:MULTISPECIES: hypothetical protein [unclassified Rhodococcus (in: high G+C Gram-positive bacteria)]|uniref:hypothetical protein n=1 Tax=unclassified Rhodococcus (in: high G+C Gram-positive bacteria) TaxID=192944 RepID=UPI001639D84A|nr:MULTISPECIES: hypothetical protein [unclassified Rhodococcus (in: high G+C Gram-positive bacteria)]MBC2640824.1 hypothetical protein [Rhodococcus sp. 3A]MBC2894432.1 hypothetical protein [Rhodococcus sp. 4CII]